MGSLIQVEFVSNVYLEGDEKVIQCNIRDITERKQAQDALVKSEALLREMSVRDHLTGLFNRRYMEETLERELHRAHVNKFHWVSSCWMWMVSSDSTTPIGHAAGDAILRELGNMLLRHVREEDIACRFGGDEFIIVLPDAGRDVTCERAQLICESARQLNPPSDGQTLDPITLSLGVAVFPENGSSNAAILKAADEALYRAKRAGGGRVVVEK